MKSLAKQIVLITGAGGGFGQELTRQLLQVGCQLILTDREVQLLRPTLAAAARAGADGAAGRILGYAVADLASVEGCELLYKQCRVITPDIDILINNAGIGLSGLISDVPQERWERLLQINLLAPMRLTARFLPGMLAQGSGHIVNICSVAGLVGAPGLSIYCTAKFGLRGFSEALAADVNKHGIDVSAIYPFFARTPILESARFGEQPANMLPDWLLYDPAFIIAELIAGIRRRKLHIYPGAIARQIDLLRRMMPWTLPLVVRALEHAAASAPRR